MSPDRLGRPATAAAHFDFPAMATGLRAGVRFQLPCLVSNPHDGTIFRWWMLLDVARFRPENSSRRVGPFSHGVPLIVRKFLGRTAGLQWPARGEIKSVAPLRRLERRILYYLPVCLGVQAVIARCR